ncbi:MAG: penicillin acylase family protein [Nostoc sp.]
MIVDLGNLDNSVAIHTPGQSGHAFHSHYNYSEFDLGKRLKGKG